MALAWVGLVACFVLEESNRLKGRLQVALSVMATNQDGETNAGNPAELGTLLRIIYGCKMAAAARSKRYHKVLLKQISTTIYLERKMSVFNEEDGKTVKSLMLSFAGIFALTVGLIILAVALT
jgi:hypothetical protein|tara:strand:+ start:459 stop:827 length:369 start_codon:yes stop_codon:yes gene_type:complete